MAPNNSNLNDSWVRVSRSFDTREVPIVQILEINSDTESVSTTENASESDSVINIINSLGLRDPTAYVDEEIQQTIIEDKMDNYLVHFVIHTLGTIWGIQFGQQIYNTTVGPETQSLSGNNLTQIPTHRWKIIIITAILQQIAIRFGQNLSKEKQVSTKKRESRVTRKLIVAYIGYFLQDKKFNNIYVDVFSKGICLLAYVDNTIDIICSAFGNFTELEQLRLFVLFNIIMMIAAYIAILLNCTNILNLNSIFPPYDLDIKEIKSLSSWKFPIMVFSFHILLGLIDFKSIYRNAFCSMSIHSFHKLLWNNILSSIKMFSSIMRWDKIKLISQSLIKPSPLKTSAATKVRKLRVQPRSLLIAYLISVMNKPILIMDYNHLWFYNTDFILRIIFISAIHSFQLIETNIKQYSFGLINLTSQWYQMISAAYGVLVWDNGMDMYLNLLTFPSSVGLIALFYMLHNLINFNNQFSREEPFYEIFSSINWSFLIYLLWGLACGGTQTKEFVEYMGFMPIVTLTFYGAYCVGGDVETW